MPVHPRRYPRRVRTVFALTLGLLFAIHLTDRVSKVAPVPLTQFAQAPIHLTNAEA